MSFAIALALIPLHLPWFGGPFWLRLLLAIGLSYCEMITLFGFYVVFVMGLMKLRDQRKYEFDTLGDDNVVKADPDGERKLHDFLTAVTSMEARIGLIQRSAPYMPADRRPPPETRPIRTSLSRKGKRIFATTLCMGVIAGAGIALIKDIGPPPNTTGGFEPYVLVHLAAAALSGLLLSLPVALLLAAFHIEYREPDDAGADRSEAT